MDSKVVLVTGAASGIGAAIAKKFSEDGYKNLALVDVNGDKLEESAERCRQKGATKVQKIVVDLRDNEATK